MKRHLAFVVIAALAVPFAAHAQILEPERPLRLTVSPFLGYALTSTIKGVVHLNANNRVQTGVFENRVGGGPVTGVAADYLLMPRLGVNGAVTYTSRAGAVSTTAINGDLVPGTAEGGKIITLKAGGRFELVEPESSLQIYRPRAYVYGGGALLRESFPASIGGGSSIHPGLNIGVEAEFMTLSRRVTLRFGAEDTYVFWRNRGLSQTFATEFTREFGTRAVAAADAVNGHLFGLNAAVALHF